MPFPPPANPEAAARFRADWENAGGDRLAPDLLDCLGGNSPYLADLALREKDTLRAICAEGPDAVCDRALSRLTAAAASTRTRADLAASMRTAKRHVALAASIGDLGGLWSLEQVTSALSDLADAGLRVAVRFLLAEAHARGELRLPHPATPDRGSGFTVLGMGKLGARELNFSSDVDLILLFDPDTYGPECDGLSHAFARLARDMAGLMEARDAGGYVFRVDLRLRPDPASTPPAIALPAALAYYESMGQTWERAALIKARPVAGDLTLGRRFLQAVSPFIWRRHLDFAAVADIRAMKTRVDLQGERRRAQTHLAGPDNEGDGLLGLDLKLGRGGIREIEFCAQSLQLIWGGRLPALRVPGTIQALKEAARGGHIPADWAEQLEAAYRFLRTAEHRLQMVADQQTHSLPRTEEALAGFAAFMGAPSAEAFRADAEAHLSRVYAIFDLMLAELPGPQEEAPAPKPLPVEIPPAWLEGRPRALRTERSRALLGSMLPAIAAAIARQPDPRTALTRFDEFLHRLPAGVQVLSMLHHNPALLDRLADVLGAAPSLADHLAAIPSALEGLAFPQPADPNPRATLRARLRDAAGLDDALAIASRAVRAEEFAIAVGEYFGRLDVDQAAAARTALAHAVIAEFLGRVMQANTARYGRVRGGGMVAVALGKAGSAEMMAGSDLDLMLIYDHPPDVTESTGRKPVAPSQYYARAAQSFIAALTVPTRDGPLYPVDMRLRPSGSKGPVAVSLAAFNSYHAGSAWTWEFLALTRARVVAGPAALQRRTRAAIADALTRADPARILPDTAAMRARLMRDLPPRGPWDVKLRPGGLMEVEFIAQALQLLHASRTTLLSPNTRIAFERLRKAGILSAEDATLLIGADRTWRIVQGRLRIATGQTIPTRLPAPVLDRLLQATGFGPDEDALRTGLDTLSTAVRDAFTRLVGAIPP